MKPHHAAALVLVGWYLLLPPWIAPNKFDARAPMSKWEQSGKFDSVAQCKVMLSALVDWYADHPEEKEASWFRRLYRKAQCVSAEDARLEGKIPTIPKSPSN
jgi:hypothetical protein